MEWLGTQMINDDMDNNSNGEDDRCSIERWRDLGCQLIWSMKMVILIIFSWVIGMLLTQLGSAPVAAFVFDRAVVEVNNRWTGEVDITPFTFSPEEYLKVWMTIEYMILTMIMATMSGEIYGTRKRSGIRN